MDTLAKASSSQTALTKALEATNIGKEVSNSISKAMKVSDAVNNMPKFNYEFKVGELTKNALGNINP